MELPGEAAQALEYAPPGTWVLRGGELNVDSARKNLAKCHRTYGFWGICVTAKADASPEQGALELRAGNKRFMRGLSHELADEGWPVVREPGLDWPDALLTFPNGEPDSEELERLREHLSERGFLPNPNAK